MHRFEFAPSKRNLFTGSAFYAYYKDSSFLKDAENIHRILGEGHQLRQGMKELQAGESLEVAGMFLKPEKMLTIKKGGPNVVIEDKDITINRLSGLTAAYVFEHRKNFPDVHSAEAKELGLTWDNKNGASARLYLASVTGTEHFIQQFSFVPLICAMRKVHSEKLKPEFLTKIAKIKCSSGTTMMQMMQASPQETKHFWRQFPGATMNEFRSVLSKLKQ